MPVPSDHINLLFALTSEEIQEYCQALSIITPGSTVLDNLTPKIDELQLKRYFQGEMLGIETPLTYFLLQHGKNVPNKAFVALCREYCNWFNQLEDKQLAYYHINLFEIIIKFFVNKIKEDNLKINLLTNYVLALFKQNAIEVKPFLGGISLETIYQLGNEDLIKILNPEYFDPTQKSDLSKAITQKAISHKELDKLAQVDVSNYQLPEKTIDSEIEKHINLEEALNSLIIQLQKEEKVSSDQITSFLVTLQGHFYFIYSPAGFGKFNEKVFRNVINKLYESLYNNTINNPENFKKLMNLFYESIIIMLAEDRNDGKFDFIKKEGWFKQALTLFGLTIVRGDEWDHLPNENLAGLLYKKFSRDIFKFLSSCYGNPNVENADEVFQDYKELINKLNENAANKPQMFRDY